MSGSQPSLNFFLCRFQKMFTGAKNIVSHDWLEIFPKLWNFAKKYTEGHRSTETITFFARRFWFESVQMFGMNPFPVNKIIQVDGVACSAFSHCFGWCTTNQMITDRMTFIHFVIFPLFQPSTIRDRTIWLPFSSKRCKLCHWGHYCSFKVRQECKPEKHHQKWLYVSYLWQSLL